MLISPGTAQENLRQIHKGSTAALSALSDTSLYCNKLLTLTFYWQPEHHNWSCFLRSSHSLKGWVRAHSHKLKTHKMDYLQSLTEKLCPLDLLFSLSPLSYVVATLFRHFKNILVPGWTNGCVFYIHLLKQTNIFIQKKSLLAPGVWCSALVSKIDVAELTVKVDSPNVQSVRSNRFILFFLKNTVL